MALIAGIVAVVTLYLLLQMFRTANPAMMARGIKVGGGIVVLAAAAFIGVRGEIAVAIPLGLFGAGLLGWSPRGFSIPGFGARGRSGGQTSRVRSSLLEMELQHDSGALAGRFIAGEHEGRSLDEFTLAQLLAMSATFDVESLALLESYLDRRFPAWREHAQGDRAGRDSGEAGGGRAAPSGKMTQQEAYQILGLQAGASDSDIRAAHRSLMKKFHPDQGGTTYLASRINEAKDTLLQRHRS